MTIVTSFVGLCILLAVGHWLRMRVGLLRKLYLPSCVIAGLLGLLIIQCMGGLAGRLNPQEMSGWSLRAAQWIKGIDAALPSWTAGWSELPGFLINIVFACLFLGVAIPKFRTILSRAGPQLAYGQVVAWGQYVVGVGLFVVFIRHFYDLPAMFGAIIPVGFEGGHGTAAGLAKTFEANDWAAGKDFALASATAGIISAIIFGMILINWATRRGYTQRRRSPEDVTEYGSLAVIPVDRRPSAGKLTVSSDAIESFTLHLAIVGLAILIGYLLKQGLWGVEWIINHSKPWTIRQESMAYVLARSFPLFPLCMIGGLIVQLFEDHFDKYKLIDVGLMRRIQNTSLDFLVVAAIAMIRVERLTAWLVPFFIIVAAGILWNIFCVTVLARRVLPDAWFERSIAEMGQSMGVTATGLLLLRVVDPNYETPAANAFAYKQILHEPFMGGGLWTSMAIPLLVIWGGIYGGLPVLLIACGAVAVWLVVLVVMRAARKRNAAT